MFTRDQMLPFLPVLRRRPRTFEAVVGALFLMAVTPLLWIVGLFLAPFLVPAMIRDRRQETARAAETARLLAEHFPGRTLAEVVSASPYSLGHWQGEDGYRVADARLSGDAAFVAFVPDVPEGEAFILRRLVDEKTA